MRSATGESGATMDFLDNRRLKRQFEFIIELDRVKSIFRKSRLFDGSRYENDAEHSWTICVMALVLKEYSNIDIDVEKVLKMLLLHDVVEIDAGDTFLYSRERAAAHDREAEAAERIFGLLPEDQRDEFKSLWYEFEERATSESKFASVLDRLEPLLQNFVNRGSTWKENGVEHEMVVERNNHIAEGSQRLWEVVKKLIDEALERGFFA